MWNQSFDILVFYPKSREKNPAKKLPITGAFSVSIPQTVPVLNEIFHTGIHRCANDHNHNEHSNDVHLGKSHHDTQTNHGAGGLDLATLEAEVARLTAELEELTRESAALRSEVTALSAENDLLRLRLEHHAELARHKDEIIELYRQREQKTPREAFGVLTL
mgnify:CR=1 FL=1